MQGLFIVHVKSTEREPKTKQDPSHLQKDLNPKRVRTGRSRGGSFALARRAERDLLGSGATLESGNPKS